MSEHISRQDALELMRKYNDDPFHRQHALTVEAVMKWFARELGYGEMPDIGGLLDYYMISILNYIRMSTA